MPVAYSELDRKNAADGYTVENTELVHANCHQARQAAKRYTERSKVGHSRATLCARLPQRPGQRKHHVLGRRRHGLDAKREPLGQLVENFLD